jgi:hypothetical protein
VLGFETVETEINIVDQNVFAGSDAVVFEEDIFLLHLYALFRCNRSDVNLNGKFSDEAKLQYEETNLIRYL